MKISVQYLYLNSLLDGNIEHSKNNHFILVALHITNSPTELSRMISMQRLQQ